MERRDIEIMAPVGSFESLMAAIQGGAGSIYFGVGHMNMRSRSSNNFSLDDFKKIVKIASDYDVRSYLSLNVEIFDNEAGAMHELLDTALDTGVLLFNMHVKSGLRSIFPPR